MKRQSILTFIIKKRSLLRLSLPRFYQIAPTPKAPEIPETGRGRCEGRHLSEKLLSFPEQ